MKIECAALLAFALAGLAGCAGNPAAATQASDTYRGSRLYAAYCGRCHSDSMHDRAPGKVHDLAELRNQVARWSVHAKHEFTDQEVEDVVAYLNRWHYHLGGSS